MKSKFISTVVLFSALYSAPTFAANFSTSKGHVEFLAIGRPSAIKIRGKGDSLESKLQWAEKKLQGQFSFDLNSLSTGIDMRDSHMKEKYLETEKNPKAELELKPISFEKDLCKDALALEKIPFEGTLRLHGVEKSVNGEFDIKGGKGQGHSLARFKINLSDFKVEIPVYMGIKVADQVESSVEMDWACKD